MKPRRKHWLHCSSVFHGETWTARRMTPKYIGCTEPTTPRLCVAATVGGCFSAVIFRRGHDVNVYKTVAPRSAIKPRDVHDSILTGERWIIPPVAMELVDVIPADVVDEAMWPKRDRLTRDKTALSVTERAVFYRDLLPVLERAGLEVPRWEKRLTASITEYLLTKYAEVAA